MLFTFPQSPLRSKHSGLGFNKWPIDSGTPSSVVQPISQRPSFLSHELYTNFTEISKAQTHKYSSKEAQYLRSKQLESGCKSVKITIIILLLKNTINTIDEKIMNLICFCFIRRHYQFLHKNTFYLRLISKFSQSNLLLSINYFCCYSLLSLVCNMAKSSSKLLVKVSSSWLVSSITITI